MGPFTVNMVSFKILRGRRLTDTPKVSTVYVDSCDASSVLI